ncbi:MAG: hypothetical protein BWK79_15085, partial [Beggiatoa sp. IS2]
YTYITIHDNHTDKYIINYSKKEEVDTAAEIKNDVAREVLVHFQTGPVTVTFNTDILSEGSGLAASSAYTIAIIKAVSMYQQINLSDFEICRLALELERHFNPLTGYQDTYGSGIGGFKRIDFHKGHRPSFRYLDVAFLEKYDIYLFNTGIKRSSTTVLQDVDIDKSRDLLPLVDEMESAIEAGNNQKFEDIFNQGWQRKKATSSLITEHPKIKQMDDLFAHTNMIKAVKISGAGGGGYFLLFCEQGTETAIYNTFGQHGKITKIKATPAGVAGIEV